MAKKAINRCYMVSNLFLCFSIVGLIYSMESTITFLEYDSLDSKLAIASFLATLFSIEKLICIGILILSIRGKNNTKKRLTNLANEIGLNDVKELETYLSNCEIQLADRFFVNDDYTVNMNDITIYPTSSIIDVTKERKISHYKNSLYHYIVHITTTLGKDSINFLSNKAAADTAYAQVQALLYSNKMKNMRNNSVYNDTNANESVSDNPYGNMIMDEEDIKDLDNRSDWLGSV